MSHSERKSASVRGSLLGDEASQVSFAWKLHWILRFGVAGCFIGHGAFGLITKAEWLKYFALVGIGSDWAYRLMPLIGSMDILIGSLILLYPTRALLLWGILWTLWTALLRPLTGEGIWEFLERAGNYGVPLGLFYLAGWPRTFKDWFCLATPNLDFVKPIRLEWVLRITVFCLLVGHGGFGAFMQKQVWTHYLGTLGIAHETVKATSLVPIIGWFEITLGILILFMESAGLVLFVFAWKVCVEMLHPLSGEPVWEFIERFGSYSASLALFCLLQLQDQEKHGIFRPG